MLSEERQKLLRLILDDPRSDEIEKVAARRELSGESFQRDRNPTRPDSGQQPEAPLELFRMLGPTGTVEVLLSGTGQVEQARVWLKDINHLLESPPQWFTPEEHLSALQTLAANHPDEAIRRESDKLLRRYS